MRRPKSFKFSSVNSTVILYSKSYRRLTFEKYYQEREDYEAAEELTGKNKITSQHCTFLSSSKSSSELTLLCRKPSSELTFENLLLSCRRWRAAGLQVEILKS